MDGTEVMNRGISLFLGRASDRHCSRLTLEIGTIKRTTASVARYEEGAHWTNTDMIRVMPYTVMPCCNNFSSIAIFSIYHFIILA